LALIHIGAKHCEDMSKLKDKYGRLAENLKDLQEQKRYREADVIMDGHLKNGKSLDLDENMTFLKL